MSFRLKGDARETMSRFEDDGTAAELAALDEAWDRAHPAPKVKTRRAKRAESEVFDIRTWRLPGKWRKDRLVGDEVMSKMLAGVDPARFERLADGNS